jgi:hypothetical protein
LGNVQLDVEQENVLVAQHGAELAHFVEVQELAGFDNVFTGWD